MSSDMALLSKLAEDQWAAQKRVAEAEENLKRAKEALRTIAEGQIPEVMDRIGLAQVLTGSGLQIKVKSVLKANISEENRPAAIGWLRDNGHEKLIKNTFTVIAEDQEGLEEYLTQHALEYSAAPKVHPNTLNKFVREKLEAGEDIPVDLFGVYDIRVAVVTND